MSWLLPPIILLLSALSAAAAASNSPPHPLLLPVTKDPDTLQGLQYVTRLRQRTPLVPITLVLDVGGPFLWLDCDSGYVSSTYRPALCHSPACTLAAASICGNCYSSPRPGCHNNTCSLVPENTIPPSQSSVGDLGSDVLAVSSATVPHFIFSCAPFYLLKGLSRGANGMAGLGRTDIAPPTQITKALGLPRKFGLCLSRKSLGFVSFGDFGDGEVQSETLVYTPLLTNPAIPAEYFIGVRSIRVGGKAVTIYPPLLSINEKGVGGTKVSTVKPYTELEFSIYRAVLGAFIDRVNYTRVVPVYPFAVCYDGKSIPRSRGVPDVPSIDLVMERESVYWRMSGANTMVEMREGPEGVLCMGFLDGGPNAQTSVVVGGYQMEDRLVEFDLGKSRLGFGASLLAKRAKCADLNHGRPF